MLGRRRRVDTSKGKSLCFCFGTERGRGSEAERLLRAAYITSCLFRAGDRLRRLRLRRMLQHGGEEIQFALHRVGISVPRGRAVVHHGVEQ
jgi:hypothetical protein